MATTTRLKIQTVELSDNMSPDLWNRAYNRIDAVCSGFYQKLDIELTFNTQGIASVILDDLDVLLRVIEIIPSVTNIDNWKKITVASIFVSQDTENSKKLNFTAMGIIPTDAITIHIVGWY